MSVGNKEAILSTAPNTTSSRKTLGREGSLVDVNTMLKMNLQRLEMFDPIKLSAPVQDSLTQRPMTSREKKDKLIKDLNSETLVKAR